VIETGAPVQNAKPRDIGVQKGKNRPSWRPLEQPFERAPPPTL
jgi:hypothetical protein